MLLPQVFQFKGQAPSKRASAFWLDESQLEKRATFLPEETKLSPAASFRSDESYDLLGAEDQYHYELMLRHIYKRARSNGWFSEVNDGGETRVALRTAVATDDLDATFLTAPHVYVSSEDEDYVSLLDLAGFLQCEVLVAITSRVTSVFLQDLPPTVLRIPLDASTNVQVVDTYEDFMSLRRSQFAAFVRQYNTLLIWSDDVNSVLSFGREIEEKIVNLIWDEKHNAEKGYLSIIGDEDMERGIGEDRRSISYIAPTVVAVSLMAIATFVGQDLHEVVLQIKADSNYLALGITIYFPALTWLAAFFAQTFSTIVMNMLGPVSHLTTNSKYYSANPPSSRRPEHMLPHITVQCPVYMEEIDSVLQPAMQTVKDAIKTYEMQGGTANIFVNDDGMQLLEPGDRKRRVDFYMQNGIGWVARPRDGHHGFQRAGKFKKASNMNYGMNIAYLLEEGLSRIDRSPTWSDVDESIATEATLRHVLVMQSPPALGNGDIRIGDLILLIDADTRIPSDCFLDAANEFHDTPELAILQHTSLAFQVVHNYWEDCMAYFTMYVSEAMRFMTAGGDVCPFVGHNAFLRWSAVQEVTTESNDLATGLVQRRWWSETHVSEDFELSLSLQTLGYVVRMAAYSGGEFKEGVSLTVYDEYARWQKYAYGISELVFNPFSKWPTRGPFSPLFRTFFASPRISLTSKYTMLAYMGSYYAIASAWILALLNFFIIGWAEVSITALYQSSFEILIATLVVFDVAVPVANAVYRYRTRQAPLIYAMYENFKWICILCVFFGGLSLHITQSLLWHLLGIPLHWEATAKTLESSYFLREIPGIWRRYRGLYLVLAAIALALVLPALPVLPEAWRIRPSVVTGLPVGWVVACHALGPLLLNPQSWLSEVHM